LHEKKLSSLQTLLPILEAVVQSGKPLLIGCPSVAGLLITTEAMVGENRSPRVQLACRQAAWVEWAAWIGMGEMRIRRRPQIRLSGDPGRRARSRRQ
jgi:hypothetical protein